MAVRLLPRTLPELYAHAIVLEREAANRFAVLARCMRDAGLDYLAEEFEAIGKEERERSKGAVGRAVQAMPERGRSAGAGERRHDRLTHERAARERRRGEQRRAEVRKAATGHSRKVTADARTCYRRA
jgi:hypothetical protein